MRHAYVILVGISHRKRPHWWPRRRWGDNIKRVIRTIVFGCRIDGTGSGEVPLAGFCEFSTDSSSCIKTGNPSQLSYGLDDRGEDFLLLVTASRPALGPTQPPIQWVSEALFPRIKRPGHEIDHSPPSSAEDKNCGAIPPLLRMSSWCSAWLSRRYIFMVWCLVKQRDN
jgi:hypothetical protein